MEGDLRLALQKRHYLGVGWHRLCRAHPRNRDGRNGGGEIEGGVQFHPLRQGAGKSAVKGIARPGRVDDATRIDRRYMARTRLIAEQRTIGPERDDRALPHALCQKHLCRRRGTFGIGHGNSGQRFCLGLIGGDEIS